LLPDKVGRICHPTFLPTLGSNREAAGRPAAKSSRKKVRLARILSHVGPLVNEPYPDSAAPLALAFAQHCFLGMLPRCGTSCLDPAAPAARWRGAGRIHRANTSPVPGARRSGTAYRLGAPESPDQPMRRPTRRRAAPSPAVAPQLRSCCSSRRFQQAVPARALQARTTGPKPKRSTPNALLRSEPWCPVLGHLEMPDLVSRPGPPLPTWGVAEARPRGILCRVPIEWEAEVPPHSYCWRKAVERKRRLENDAGEKTER
jgi:hypothetical protein